MYAVAHSLATAPAPVSPTSERTAISLVPPHPGTEAPERTFAPQWVDVAPPAISGAEVGVDVDELPQPTTWALAARRTLDIVISVVAIVLLAPLMIVVALIVRRTSPGPAIFKQTRMGLGGRHFSVYKFRSMRDGAHDEVQQNEALREAYRNNDFKLGADDPRITRVGSILRKTSLDELPQLFNVLLGHMSIVGIRPLLFEEVGIRSVYDQQLYKLMRPGMTGLWQVAGRSNVDQQDRILLDRTYVEGWSVVADLKILVQTPLAVVRTAETC